MTTKTKNELKLEDERTYEDVKKSIISKSEEVETKTSEIRSELTVATLILQQKRNKKKKEAREILWNDFVAPEFVGKTLMYEVTDYIYANDEEKAEINKKYEELKQKRRLAYQLVSSGNLSGQSQVFQDQDEGGADDDTEQSNDDIRAKYDPLSKGLKAAKSQVTKHAPTTETSDLLNEDEDEEEEEEDDNNINQSEMEAVSKFDIVINNQSLIEKIVKCLNEERYFTIRLNRKWEPIDIEAGNSFSSSTSA